jgi:hypothetical protein
MVYAQVRAASELSVAGSELGGRCSEDDAGYSMDGRFSCSSLYSEFGHVASHLEERHPGLVLARSCALPIFLLQCFETVRHCRAA